VIVAALDWPLLYAVKLGQVEPILFLGFAAAWRGIDRAGVVGTAAAVGALIKVQPGLLVVWAIATRRFRAVAVAVAIGVALVAVTTVFTGIGAWASYVDLLRGMGGDLSTPHNFAPGAVAHLAGASDGMATVVQLASVALAVAALALALRYAPADISLLVTILASQLISSPLRDHYAVLLLLPTAYLVQRGKNWAVMFPLLGWATLFADGSSNAWLATASVSLTFFGCLAVLLWEARQQRGSAPIHVAPAYA
jgi:hypothetical protein